MRPWKSAFAVLVVLTVLVWSLSATSVHAQQGDPETKPQKGKDTVSSPQKSKDPLPNADDIQWNVKAIEKGEFTVQKRTVQGNKVIWVLKTDTDKGVHQIADYFPAASGGGFWARFLDEDGVELAKVRIEPSTTEVAQGGSVRLTLTLPGQQTINKTQKVVVVHVGF